MNLHLCTAGTNKQTAEHFWAGVQDLDLFPSQAIQVNTAFGRGLDNRRNYPEDFPPEEHEALETGMKEQVARVLLSTYIHHDADQELAFIDYEARKYGSDGTIAGNWLLEKLRHGYNKHDISVMRKLTAGMRSGMSEANLDGIEVSAYTLPRVTKGPAVPKDYDHANEGNAFANQYDWAWVNGYQMGDPDRDHIDHENLADHIKRLRDGRELAMLGIRAASSGMTKRVIGAITVLGLGLDREELRQYNTVTIEVMYRLGYTDLLIWVDCNHQSVADRQLESLTDLKDQLDRVV